jgi:hypothetical protein
MESRHTLRLNSHETEHIKQLAIRDGLSMMNAVKKIINETGHSEKNETANNSDLQNLKKRMTNLERCLSVMVLKSSSGQDALVNFFKNLE